MDQEFVLRFMAVCYYGINNYEGVPDNYLNGAMEYLNSPDCADKKAFMMRSAYVENMLGEILHDN
jgi:hypothetical protein